MKIEKYISQLLFDYDCVIIPGLGGFVTNYSPAQFNVAKGLLSPPSKAIIFNRNLINNDGLLVNHISAKEKLSYNDANNMVNVFVFNCKNQLSNGKRIEFDELGVLYEDGEGTIQFRPDFSVNFLTSSFGLSPVVAKEVVQTIKTAGPVVETVKKVEEKEKTEKIERKLDQQIRTVEPQPKQEPKVVEVRKRRVGRYVLAAAIAVPVIFYSVWIPLKTDVIKTGTIEVADLNPFRTPAPDPVYASVKNTVAEYVPEIMPTIEESEKEEPLIIASAESDVDTTYVNLAEVNENKKTNNYHLIAGCFREEENAVRMVEFLKSSGYNAFILDEVNGLKRVSAASYNDMGPALKELHKMRNDQVAEVWLLNLR